MRNTLMGCLFMRSGALGGRETESKELIQICATDRKAVSPSIFHSGMTVALMARHDITPSHQDFHGAFIHGVKAVLAKMHKADCTHQLELLADIYIRSHEKYKRRPCLHFKRARARVLQPGTTTRLPHQLIRRIATVTSAKRVCLVVPTRHHRDRDTCLPLLKALMTVGSDPTTRRQAATLLGLSLCHLNR